jgi:type VI secretion system protein ImpK
MQDETANLVHAVFRQGLDLKGRLERGEPPNLAVEQIALERLLSEESEAGRYADLSGNLDIRYALVCWLDEIFILDSTWGELWNEHKLEVIIFQTNDRAWRFWEKARRAAARSDTDVLEVYYLCVILGFRGELRGDTEQLNAWVTVSRTQIEKAQGQAWVAPPELEPPSNVPPLRGEQKFQTMVLRAAVALLLLIPVVAFFVVLQLGR